MGSEEPNFRAYHAERLKKIFSDPQLTAMCAAIQKEIDAMLMVKGNQQNPERKEEKIATKYVCERWCELWGFKPTKNTTIAVHTQEIDISGAAEYIDKELARKYNIRTSSDDFICIEFKLCYRANCLTVKQKKAARNGKLHAVISFAGSAVDFVEGTDCPIIYLQKRSDSDLNKFDFDSFGSNKFEYETIESVLTYLKTNYPNFVRAPSEMANVAQGIRAILDPKAYRSYETLILYLGATPEFCSPSYGESEKDYHNRVFAEIDRLLDLDEPIPEIDYAFNLSGWAYQSKKGSNRCSVVKLENMERRKNSNLGWLLGDENVNYLYETKIDRFGCPSTFFADWLVKELGINKFMHWYIAGEFFSHVHTCYVPRGFKSQNVSPYVREIFPSIKHDEDYKVSKVLESQARKNMSAVQGYFRTKIK